MRVVGYTRVSTDGQCADDKFGLSVQKQQIEKYCNDNNYEIVGWYTDEGESGAKERPGFDSIVYEMETDDIDAVVVAKTDRVARDINVYYYYKMILLKKDVKLISLAEDFEQFGVFAPMLEAFTLCVADMERNNITKRTTSGRKAKARQGGFAGGTAPFGYRVKNKELVIDRYEVDTVREIFRLYDDECYGSRRIATIINNKGCVTRSGKQFTPSSVKSILDNRKTYQGYYHYSDGDWVKGRHEAIL